MKPLNIAMDGPAGAGKSSIADEVARRLGILHLDTGAMYRALGLGCVNRGVDPTDEQAVVAVLPRIRVEVACSADGQRTLLDGQDVSDAIRTEAAGNAASCVSRYADVRRAMVRLQQEAASRTAMVVDGRDICLRVLPNADVKIYLTASAEERARRRWVQLQEKGKTDSFEQVLADLIKRDEQDMNREVDPLRPTPDAIIVDTSDMDFEASVTAILKLVEEKSHV